VTITPVLDEVGEVKYCTVLMQDITARKAREEELRERNAELEASIRYAARLQRAFLPKNLDGLRLIPFPVRSILIFCTFAPTQS
jgi:hypothetical protein